MEKETKRIQDVPRLDFIDELREANAKLASTQSKHKRSPISVGELKKNTEELKKKIEKIKMNTKNNSGIKCFFGIHQGKWQDTELERNVRFRKTGETKVETELGQSRHCEECGLLQIRQVRA